MAHDDVSVIGTDEQLTSLIQLLGPSANIGSSTHISYGLGYVVLEERSPFVGKTIRESGLREATDGLIVGIERQGDRILNPDSLLTLNPDDGLWIVGNKKLISSLQKASEDL